MTTELITPPSELPLTLPEVTAHLKLEDDEAEAQAPLLQGYLRSVVTQVEHECSICLCTQTWREYFECWPGPPGYFSLSKRPLISVSHIKAYDDDDVATTWASSNYFVDAASRPGRVYPRKSSVFADFDRVANPIEIEYVAGFGARNQVPEDIRHALLLMVADRMENRGDMNAPAAISSAVADLLRPHKLYAAL